jgi:hypothetical protein
MTWFGDQVSFKDGPNLDAFNRLRVSTPVDLFASIVQYNTSPLFWEAVTTGGSVTHLPNESGVQLSTGAGTSGNFAIHQTKLYHRYQPGKSQMIFMTFNFGSAGDTNVTRRLGYYDDNNGLFLEQAGTSVRWVRRTFTSGSIVDNAVAQASWSIDPMDGTGPSGITLDFTKAQFMFVDFEWQGVGRARCGFFVGGTPYLAHEFNSQNMLETVYMTTPHLPLRYEIRNTGTASGATTMRQFCQSVSSEGGVAQEPGIPFSASNGITTIAVTTRRPVLSLRLASTLNGIAYRGHIEPLLVELSTSTNDAYWELVYNGSLTGAAFAAVNSTHSGAEFDVAATAITGGVRLAAGFVTAGFGIARGSTAEELTQKLTLAKTYAGVSDIISVVCTSFTGTSNISSAITWREQY